MKRIILAALLAAATYTFAADVPTEAAKVVATPPPQTESKSLLQRAIPQDVSLSLYGAYTVAEPNGFQRVLRSSIKKDGDWGTGAKLDAYFGKNFGLTLDSTVRNATDGGGAAIDTSRLGPTLRFPSHLLGLSFAPYGKGYAGRDWEQEKWFIGAGAGVSVDFSKQTFAFVEANYDFKSRHARGADAIGLNFGLGYRFR